jgi:hypothetical protein
MAKNNSGGSSSVDVGLLKDGSVVIQFAEAVRHVTFTPAQAEVVGMALIKNAAHGESIQRVQPPGQTAVGPRRKQ